MQRVTTTARCGSICLTPVRERAGLAGRHRPRKDPSGAAPHVEQRLRRRAAGVVRGPGRARGRPALPPQRHPRAQRPPRAARRRWRAPTSGSVGAVPSTTTTGRCDDALEAELRGAGHDLPRLLGQPQLAPVPRRRRGRDGRRRRAAARSPSSPRRSRRTRRAASTSTTSTRARAEVGPDAPRIDKIRPYFNHPGFVAAWTDAVALGVRATAPRPGGAGRGWSSPRTPSPGTWPLAATTRRSCGRSPGSSPRRWPDGRRGTWSGRAAPVRRASPGSSPTSATTSRPCHRDGVDTVVLAPIGFVSDHMEVVWDLDTVAWRSAPRGWGSTWCGRPPSAPHPRFVAMARELVEERLDGPPARGRRAPAAPNPHRCPEGCCRP